MTPEIAHIQTNQVFAEFQLTSELKAKLENTEQSRKTLLDNMELQLQQLASREKAPQDSLQQLGEAVDCPAAGLYRRQSTSGRSLQPADMGPS